MNFAYSKIQLAIVALTATIIVAAPLASPARDNDQDRDDGAKHSRDRGEGRGHYLTGDFHNHTTCTDGTLSMKKLIDKSVVAYGLDWFVQSGHGSKSGNAVRNCTIDEDPLEPVPPSTNLTANTTGPYPPFTYPSGGQPVTTGKGPNQYWTDTIGNGAIKGDVLDIPGIATDASGKPLPPGTTRSVRQMWRWQMIDEYVYPKVEAEARLRDKPIIVGLELQTPGHEHTMTVAIDGQLPAAPAKGNANSMGQFEYCFDINDTDTSRGAGNQWNCAVPGSANNALLDATAQKILGANSAATPNRGHTKSVEGVKWMTSFYPEQTYFVPAHLERAGPYNPVANRGFNIEHLRDYNNAGPAIAFGFESMPGHQAEGARGSYSPNAVGGGTYGGTGIYAAAIGGVWDALLGEGRNWWFFASSDYHNRGSFGPDQRESTADLFPGEYTRDHVMIRTSAERVTPQAIVDGLRSGNSFVANGQLIDRLSFVVCASGRGEDVLSIDKVEEAAYKAALRNTAIGEESDDDFGHCATMGGKLKVRPGTDLVVSIVLRDPPGVNNSPYSFNNPVLKQIGISQPLNQPVLDHVDVIGGKVSGYVTPGSPNYAGLIGSAAATNPTTAIVKTFNSSTWTAKQGGWRAMTYRLSGVNASQYLRLRGTNLPAGTPYKTDSSGNPLLDFGSAGKIPCLDAMCPPHMTTVNGTKYSSFDVAAWADLWFYSNPVFVEVRGSVAVAGIQ